MTMDMEEAEMKSLGLCGSYKESLKLVLAWKKVFLQITVALILPLSLIYLTFQEASTFLFIRIVTQTINLDQISNATTSVSYDVLSSRVSREYLWYWLIKIFYFTILLIFSLLATAAVTFTVASVYARRDLAFRLLMSSTSKVWKRLVITYICTYVVFFLYSMAFVVFIIIWINFLVHTLAGSLSMVIVSILYLLGLAYLSVIWQLTYVISILEDYKGFKAMKKSQKLMKGKFWLGFFVPLIPGLAIVGIQAGFLLLVVDMNHMNAVGVLGRVLLGLAFVVLSLIVILFSLVIQAVLYFVCKSYHDEVVHRPSLDTQLREQHNNDGNAAGPPKVDGQVGDPNNV